MGKGIAFSKHKGDEIRADAIDKTFVLSSPDSLNQFAQLLKDIPYEYVTLAQEIIAYAMPRKLLLTQRRHWVRSLMKR